MIVGGDLWQSRASQTLATLMAAREAVLKATSQLHELVLAPGNHDKVDPESVFSYNHIFKGYPGVTVPDHAAGWQLSDSVSFSVVSYFPENGSFTKVLKTVASELGNNRTNILYCHQGINGALSKSSDKELAPEVFEFFDKVLVGHYHDRTVLADGKIEYIGSSRQHNFGEDEEKGYTILYKDGSTEFVKNTVNIRYKTLEVTADNLAEVKQALSETTDDNVRVKVKISCTSDQCETIDKKELVDLGASKVEVISETTMTQARLQDLEAKYNKDGLKDEYTRFCIQKDLNNVELGLKYLDKIQGICGD